jgi:hypothetical protein
VQIRPRASAAATVTPRSVPNAGAPVRGRITPHRSHAHRHQDPESSRRTMPTGRKQAVVHADRARIDRELRAIERVLVAGIAPERQIAALHRMLGALTRADLIALRDALRCSDDAGVFLTLLGLPPRGADDDTPSGECVA